MGCVANNRRPMCTLQRYWKNIASSIQRSRWGLLREILGGKESFHTSSHSYPQGRSPKPGRFHFALLRESNSTLSWYSPWEEEPTLPQWEARLTPCLVTEALPQPLQQHFSFLLFTLTPTMTPEWQKYAISHSQEKDDTMLTKPEMFAFVSTTSAQRINCWCWHFRY